MDIEAIKELIKAGDLPLASEQLREMLAKTPEDAAARMLYGTCCQLMGDSATFGRIYRDLAPEMEPRVTSGERSELVSMWLKYAAMFAVVLTCFYGALGEDVAPEISNATNAMEVVSVANTDDLYDRVMKMSQRDRMESLLLSNLHNFNSIVHKSFMNGLHFSSILSPEAKEKKLPSFKLKTHEWRYSYEKELELDQSRIFGTGMHHAWRRCRFLGTECFCHRSRNRDYHLPLHTGNCRCQVKRCRCA